ncbi:MULTISPECIES: nucleoside triphosphate pyrophosphohydrolase [Ruminococcus]|jgi:tetrapyrrole methylase family protein/MazG family protein|uniref:nucleoside triphosphate pyrophosphohydrolase n=1 Tax=Ruminococcus TaxID=1263 RepID=UPI0013DCFAEF|nr:MULTISPECIES: nucleoside triphosphate pyrophosphohydrolase [Ruminococcus]MBQ6170946.1 nucleoside triphosphate pyrophosphohydrolase [Ruminococcus sp.]MBQ6251658.1 nucleoside triphosphate pyrophosphohydrolase [Ruminococcus sp.]MBR1429645.1 nucleoside triphosphate pyrophosphohydrolase [Ruminococcus sp.]MBR3667138.1 nucleoside triphosphate pyrophosphohydrolase [Ruminococcus sp.]MBR6997090.1 nucleoside triphosphate pyrophosphohydrolase [Ruminococcus sp.]
MVEYQQKEFYRIGDLVDIVRLLRGEGGCPWDREQTHKSIKSDLIEETCEVIEAIDLEDKALLREELGDVLLQVVFHCRIEEETESFNFDDVCDEICKKLIIRHPHVFGDVTANTTDQVLKNWDAIKMETKGQEKYTDTLTSVAKSLPALMRAQKVGKRAMRAGMDFRCAEDAVACISNEKAELDAAIANGDKANIEEEIGDLLFSCVNAARHLGVDAEQALKDATEKFIKRFSVTEELVSAENIDMKELPIEELDTYWDKAKSIICKTEERKND